MPTAFILSLFILYVLATAITILLFRIDIQMLKKEVSQQAYKADVSFLKEDVKTLSKEAMALHKHLNISPYYTSPSIIFTKKPE